ncbi:CIC11C00000004656 [Sungouiella intermedia]|uniref:CIC11C00000004656 n=1 Tax=Sungouiella intermedia TaxID=45354 RepID=A0A1L0D1T4_9ASCO|nr:CIC11C00000004656 [[Candida] intermedia]
MSKKPSRSHHALSLTGGTAASKLVFVFSQITRLVHAMPVGSVHSSKKPEHLTTEEFYINLFTSAFLVLAGGVFAGLTLGLMGQDEVYLKVIAHSGEPQERKYARKVLRLIGRGKHWVLVTLLLSNVITNETLPIVLDRCLGGGWPAVVTSTASIVIFGEIIPQSICVRYGLQVGAIFAPFVLVLMYIMYPVAYPCAMLLDHILGEDHGTVYKKSGLKTLVTLHKTMGVERLNQDEVTIISAVLDLKEKSVSHIMTPMDRVYTMSSDLILDEKTVEEIFNAGFSRIPIHLPNEPLNFIGMLLVRVLISYDPEDALPVALFPLATLPETSADTSCLNILNYFQEGKSHMIVVSETPGEPTGALGVLTLEDVIEELIGEEIVDESDVYIDINNNIKRKHPGPLLKRNLTAYLHNLYQQSANNSKRNSIDSSAPTGGTSAPSGGAVIIGQKPLIKPAHHDSSPNRTKGMGLPFLAPLNPAANPLETSKSFVTIKRPTPADIAARAHLSTSADRGGSIPQVGTEEGVYPTEDAALEEGRQMLSDDNLNGAHSHSKLPHSDSSRGVETDVTEINGNGNGSNSNGHGYTIKQSGRRTLLSHSDPISITEFLESRSYRTGGIVESVVNVQGVHKTIIEDFTEDENSDVEYGSYGSRSNKRSNTGSEETQRLINF